jgi:hypothetical protein
MSIHEKINLGNTVTMGQILEFEITFPEEKRKRIDEYLLGVSRTFILQSAAYFLGFKHHNSKYSDNRKFLSMYFRKENNEIANRVYDRITKIESKGIEVNIINSFSSLRLFEYFFSKEEEPETQTEAESEISLFKAYLALNSEYITKQSVAYLSASKCDEELIIPMLMFCMQYPVSDKTNLDINEIWTTQMIKSIYLFQFLESHVKTQQLLSAFLSHFNCLTWQEYLKSIIPLTIPSIKREKESHTDINIEPGEHFEKGCEFLEKLMIHDNDELDENDFLTIRAKPFYKIKDGVYRIIFELFVVEKIFKGVYFLLRDVNKTLDKPIKEIKSFYGDEFSEKVLLYKVIESIFPENCICFSGKQLSDMKIDGAPDYYVRKGKNILVFESKDFLIAAEKKMSFDFDVYEEEFQKVLYFEEMTNGKEKPKAVLQLINCIRKILKKEIYADTDYHYRDVTIYPILVVHDSQYNTTGFNELIDYWFQDELLGLKQEGLFIHYVKPLSVVNIDSLIYNQVGLANGIPLHEMLKLYHENKKIEKNKRKFKSQEEYDTFFEEFKQIKMSKLIPFSVFINKYFNKKDVWKLPPIMNLIGPALFKEEFAIRENQTDNNYGENG